MLVLLCLKMASITQTTLFKDTFDFVSLSITAYVQNSLYFLFIYLIPKLIKKNVYRRQTKLN
jgi:hypothetical protein